MKRLFCLLLVLLALCGCATNVRQPQTPTEGKSQASTEPSGSYTADSTVEMFTEGAIREYVLDLPDVYAIAAAGSDLLVFSGVGSTMLTRLSGDNLYISAQIQLTVAISPGDPGVLILEDRVVYYDQNLGEMVFLDAAFREFNRLKVPSGMIGAPVLSGDCLKLYYCTTEGIRVLDVEEKISRLLKQTTTTEQNAVALLAEDSVLQCFVADGDGRWKSLFLNVETGELLEETTVDTGVSSGAGLYYAYVAEGDRLRVLFDRKGERPRELLPLSVGTAQFVPNAAGALVHSRRDERWMLDYYDLYSGCLTSSVVLPESVEPWQYAGDPAKGYIYFLGHGNAESEALYRWDLNASLTQNATVYTDAWYTQNFPDTEGLQVCQDAADALGQRYGLNILIWEQALEKQPQKYAFTAEYRTGPIGEALEQLQTLLSDFPEDFFTQAMEGLDGQLHLCLVKELVEAGSVACTDGIQFRDGDNAYVVLPMTDGLERAFYHELFHVLETRAMSRSIAYYRWDERNPKGFRYDNDYIANQNRDGSEYLEDDTTRAFIDVYSMSFAKEDRARIFEYACMEGSADYFRSATMQKKLRTLCEGLREAYGLEKSPETFLWEQYLESPLAYAEK